MIFKFTGSANAVVSIEVNINYEVIPTSNIDAFSMKVQPSGNPANVQA